jgi:hypothetical protein
MSSSIVRSESQEERELRLKLLELKAIKDEILQKEAELLAIVRDLNLFKESYDTMVSRKREELQRIEKLIDDALSESQANPINSEIRSVYRQLAKLIHPDLCSNTEEQEIRRDLMLQANQAFDEGDIETLKSMLSKLEGQHGESGQCLIKTRLELVLSQISESRKRLSQTTIKILRTTQSELYKTMVLHDKYMESGRDHLAELSQQLDIEICQAENRLRNVLQKHDH